MPAICCLELATFVAKGRITLDRQPLQWIHDALAAPEVSLIAQTPASAVKAASLLSSFSGDPADRLIVASALVEFAPLVTGDERVQGSGLVEAIWI